MAITRYSDVLALPDLSIIGQATENMAVGDIVYVSGGTAALPLFAKALADSSAKVAGPLYMVRGALNGVAIVNGSKVLVAAAGVREGLSGSPTAGDSVYVNDSGVPALTPGTVNRIIGIAAAPGGGNYVLSFNGAKPGAGSTPTGNPNKLARYDNAGNLASAANIEDDNTNAPKFSAGLQLTRGPFRADVTDVFLAAGANYNVADIDVSLSIRLNGAAGAARTITLPATPVAGRFLYFKDADSQAANSAINVLGNGNVIDGQQSVSFGSAGSGGLIQFVGANGIGWSVVAVKP